MTGQLGFFIMTLPRQKYCDRFLASALRRVTMIGHASVLAPAVVVALVGAPALAQDAAKATEREAGQLLFNNACRTCHTTKDGDNRLGPHLYGIIGRKAGSLTNYGYSAAMAGADIRW